MYVLVRHAHAGDKKGWAGDDADRPVSARGRQQAEGLALTLRAAAPRRLLSSPYLRCRQSLEPLGRASLLPVTAGDLLRPDADPEALDRWLSGAEADGAVLCTHGETLNALFELWTATRTWERTGHGNHGSSTEKGAAWIVTRTGGTLVARYTPPLHLGAPTPVGS